MASYVGLVVANLSTRSANETRRSLFVRQINRPTFQTSGLSDLCTFLEYSNVFTWYRRLARDVKL